MKPKMKNCLKIALLVVTTLAIQSMSLRINSSKNIEINALTSSDHLFIELKQLEYFPKHKKIKFINDMIKKYPEDLLVFKNNE